MDSPGPDRDAHANPMTPASAGLNENHERYLLASCQYAAKLLADFDQMLATLESPSFWPRYVGDIDPPRRKLLRAYLGRLQTTLRRMLDVFGITVPPPRIDVTHALRTLVVTLDIAMEELRPRYMRGYGTLPASAAATMEGLASELRELVSELDQVLAVGPAHDLHARVTRLDHDESTVADLQRLQHFIEERGLLELRGMLAGVIDRAEERLFEIALFGRVSSGKSSLLNRILGQPVLPVGVLPVTSVPTRLRRGPDTRVVVSLANGRTENHALTELAAFVTEQQNPGNEKQVTRIIVQLPIADVPEGVSFVDTPGLGSLATAGAAETRAYLPRCDLAIVLIDANAPLSDEDVTTLSALHAAAIPTIVLLSKSDLLSDADLRNVQTYVSNQLERQLGMRVAVRPVSTLPSHAALLKAWIDDDLTPLYRQQEQLRASSLRQKVDLLKRRTAATLTMRTGRRRDVTDSTRLSRAHAAREALRELSAKFAATENACRDVAITVNARVEQVLDAASRVIVEQLQRGEAISASTESPAAVAAMAHEAQVPARLIVERLTTLYGAARHTLTQAADALDQRVELEEDASSVARDLPRFDVHVSELHVAPPWWTRVSANLLRNWTAEHVRQSCGDTVEKALRAYGHVLQSWAMEMLTRLRRAVDAHAQPLAEHLDQLIHPTSGTPQDQDGIREDLTWLMSERPEEAVAASASAP